MILFELWRETVHKFPNDLALLEVATGRTWTFAQLEAAAAAMQPSSRSEIVFPQSQSAAFITTLLIGWRTGLPVCPIEPNQPTPDFQARPPDGAHLKITSATAGASRLVLFKAEQLIADAENIVTTMELRREWPNLGAISLAHSYGFSNLVLPLLIHGIPLILLDSPMPARVLEAARLVPHLTIAGVPALWRTWHETNAIPKNTRLAISAGAALPLALEQAVFQKHRLKIHNFYGASECGGIAYDASAAPRANAELAGAPLRNVRLSIHSDGCLKVQSQAVGQSYFPSPDPRLSGGIFQTSDLAEIENGTVFLRGRATDVIHVAGRKISPEPIEAALLAHPAVRECVVFGVPSEGGVRGETVVACVSLNEEMSATALRESLSSVLPAWQVPREWWFVDGMHPNSRGKISRSEWRRRYLARDPSL